jgi:hypothetical protein
VSDEKNEISLFVLSHLGVFEKVGRDPVHNVENTGDQFRLLIGLVERPHEDALLLSEDDDVSEGSGQLVEELKVDLVLRLGELGCLQLRL